MLQSIIVYILIFAVVVYTIYSLVKSLRKKEKSPCDDCNGCDLKRELTSKLHDYQHENQCGTKSK